MSSEARKVSFAGGHQQLSRRVALDRKCTEAAINPGCGASFAAMHPDTARKANDRLATVVMVAGRVWGL